MCDSAAARMDDLGWWTKLEELMRPPFSHTNERLAELMNNKTAAATWSAPAGSHVAAASECSRRAELTQ